MSKGFQYTIKEEILNGQHTYKKKMFDVTNHW